MSATKCIRKDKHYSNLEQLRVKSRKYLPQSIVFAILKTETNNFCNNIKTLRSKQERCLSKTLLSAKVQEMS